MTKIVKSSQKKRYMNFNSSKICFSLVFLEKFLWHNHLKMFEWDINFKVRLLLGVEVQKVEKHCPKPVFLNLFGLKSR